MYIVHSNYFCSASSSPPLLLLRGAPDEAWILYRSFTSKRHMKLRVKDLSKVPTWRLEQDSNPQAFGRKDKNLPMSHHAPQCVGTNSVGSCLTSSEQDELAFLL